MLRMPGQPLRFEIGGMQGAAESSFRESQLASHSRVGVQMCGRLEGSWLMDELRLRVGICANLTWVQFPIALLQSNAN